MATEWGRKETIFWPPHVPIWTYSAVLLTLVCTVLFGWDDSLLCPPCSGPTARITCDRRSDNSSTSTESTVSST